MKKIFTAKEMQEVENNTINNIGMPSLVLMERAALAVCEELKQNFDLAHILVVCGSGNNGADGMAVARLLHNQGYDVNIWFTGNESSLTEEAKLQWQLAKKYNITFINEPYLEYYTVIVDGIFGIGLNRDIQGKYSDVITQINDSEVDVLAIDIPSGINATTGKVMGIAVKAKETVSFAYGKTGLYLNDGYAYCGKITIKDIGIYNTKNMGITALEDDDIGLFLPERKPDGNKGTFGKVLIVAGSKNMAGAAYLASRAAFASGTGMVKIFTDESNRVILQTLIPEAMMSTYTDEDTKENVLTKLKECENWADCVLCGPGLGMNENARFITEYLLNEESIKPLVLDADSLNIISKLPNRFENVKRDIIITPHMGEMARLSGYTINELKDSPFEKIKEFNKNCNINIIMKDARTVTLSSDGQIYINLSGNDGMATAGSGDTLTGIIAGLLAQGMKPEEAAPLAAYLHGKAGDKAAEDKGKRAMTASDIAVALGEILK